MFIACAHSRFPIAFALKDPPSNDSKHSEFLHCVIISKLRTATVYGKGFSVAEFFFFQLNCSINPINRMMQSPNKVHIAATVHRNGDCWMCVIQASIAIFAWDNWICPFDRPNVISIRLTTNVSRIIENVSGFYYICSSFWLHCLRPHNAQSWTTHTYHHQMRTARAVMVWRLQARMETVMAMETETGTATTDSIIQMVSANLFHDASACLK